MKNPRAVLGLILLLGTLLRLWGIRLGLPQFYRPDEEFVVSIAMGAAHGSFNPHAFFYPTLYNYILAAVYTLVRLFGALPLIGFGPDGFFGYVNQHGFALVHLIGRYTAVSLGVLSLYALYRISRVLWDERRGLLAVFLLAVNFSSVRDSHFVTPDIPMTLFMIFALEAMLNVAQHGRRKDYIWAGIFTGLAFSVKYTAACMIFPMLVAHTLAVMNNRQQHGWRRLRLGDLLLCGALVVVCFLAGTPYAPIEWKTFLENTTYQTNFMRDGLPGVVMDFGWTWLLGFGLRFGVGFGMMAMAVIGAGSIVGAARHHADRRGWVVLGFVAGVCFMMLRSKLLYLRYVVTVTPGIALLAAYGLFSLYQLLAHSRWRALAKPLVTCAVAAIIAGPLYRIVQTNRLFSTMDRDTRTQARAWIEKNIPPGTAIGTHTYFAYGKVQLPPGYHYIDFNDPNVALDGDNAVRWVITDRHPGVPHFSPDLSEKAQRILQERYEKTAFFTPFVQGAPFPQFEPADAFYVPLNRFASVQTTGTELTIYRLRERSHES